MALSTLPDCRAVILVMLPTYAHAVCRPGHASRLWRAGGSRQHLAAPRGGCMGLSERHSAGVPGEYMGARPPSAQQEIHNPPFENLQQGEWKEHVMGARICVARARGLPNGGSFTNARKPLLKSRCQTGTSPPAHQPTNHSASPAAREAAGSQGGSWAARQGSQQGRAAGEAASQAGQPVSAAGATGGTRTCP
jgi:hypothetical protein